jgi:hypothetical protein
VVSLPFLAVLYLVWSKHERLQECKSPDGRHVVDLVRADFIDRNYSVRVDGARVYWSPDFAPRHDLSFREALVWDVSGKVVVLEIAGRRIFGYDLDAKHRITDEQLLAIELAPDPPLSEYYFESEWPGIGRVRPDASNDQN